MAVYDALDALIERLKAATWKDRDPIKEELKSTAAALPDRLGALEHLHQAKRTIDDLEIRWEVEEVIEALTPAPVPEPEEETPEEPPDDGKLSAADLQMVYDDPRGLVLHRTKAGDRWFATQRDPRTGQPQTFELHATEVSQLKTQLAGSPYWVIGAGA